MERKVGLVLVAVGVLNFGLFFVHTVVLGGDAWSGRIENGEYLVSNRGRLTVVSPVVWHLNAAHGISLFITQPLAILGFLMLSEHRFGRTPSPAGKPRRGTRGRIIRAL